MTLVWRPGYTTSFADPDVQAYLTAVEQADGQSLEYPVAYAIDEFIRGCKTDGIWSAIKASCILAGARTLDGALVPLVGAAPTNVGGLFVSGDYNRKTGLVGGSPKYLNSNRNNNADPQNNAHLSVYCSANPTQDLLSFSNTDNITGGFVRIRTTSSSSISPSVPTFIGVSRSDSSSYLYRVNRITNTGFFSSSSPGSGNLFVFARNNSGPVNYSISRLSFYSIGEALDLALLDSRVTTLMNAIGAAIP